MDCLSTSDRFRTLDGQRLSVAASQWAVEIYGVFEQEGACWIQVELRGTPDHSLALKIDSQETEGEVLAYLSSWLQDPSRLTGRVLSFA